MSQAESSLEQGCRRLVESRGGVLLKLRTGGGWPDRLLLMPRRRFAFVEFKREGKEPEPLQEHRLATLRAMGFRAHAIDSRADFVKLMERMR